MREGLPQMVVRYASWRDRLRARLPGQRRRTLRLAQVLLDDQRPEMELKVRDLLLYGATYVDADGNRIPPEDVRVSDA